MTTPNLEQIIADALRVLPSPIAAEPFEPGWWRSCVTWEEIVEKAAPAVVAAIRDSGLTVIALPEAEGPDEDGQLWFGDYDIRVDMTGKRDEPHLYVYDEPRTPDAVHRHAVALIAAAKHAGDTP